MYLITALKSAGKNPLVWLLQLDDGRSEVIDMDDG